MKILKKSISIFLVSAISLFFFSCKKENRCDCIKGTGSIVIETRNLPSFDAVTVDDNVNVFISEDPVFEVKVEAGEKLISLIKTEVEGGRLTIVNKNRCNWSRSYKKPINVYIRMPNVNYIRSIGTGNIKSLNTINTPIVDLQTENSGNIELSVNNTKIVTHMFGYGDITLHGATLEHACSIGGEGFMYASDLNTNYTWIQSFTSGLSYVRATNLLTCTIDKDGDVYCYGNPTTVQTALNGNGHLYLQ